jgi:hypothetical protein
MPQAQEPGHSNEQTSVDASILRAAEAAVAKLGRITDETAARLTRLVAAHMQGDRADPGTIRFAPPEEYLKLAVAALPRHQKREVETAAAQADALQLYQSKRRRTMSPFIAPDGHPPADEAAAHAESYASERAQAEEQGKAGVSGDESGNIPDGYGFNEITGDFEYNLGGKASAAASAALEDAAFEAYNFNMDYYDYYGGGQTHYTDRFADDRWDLSGFDSRARASAGAGSYDMTDIDTLSVGLPLPEHEPTLDTKIEPKTFSGFSGAGADKTAEGEAKAHITAKGETPDPSALPEVGSLDIPDALPPTKTEMAAKKIAAGASGSAEAKVSLSPYARLNSESTEPTADIPPSYDDLPKPKLSSFGGFKVGLPKGDEAGGKGAAVAAPDTTLPAAKTDEKPAAGQNAIAKATANFRLSPGV